MTNRYRPWPLHRSFCLAAGLFSAAAAVAGPLAVQARHSFPAHMIAHLLLGMLAPLLLVLAAPGTLLFRTLPVERSRGLARFLRSRSLQVLSDPAVAALLNMGGLWILYTTELYTSMHHSPFLHWFVHIHMLLAGYLFAASLIGIDPKPHRTGFVYRAIVLVTALAAHGTLSKYIYAHPPAGVPLPQAEAGGMIMYYGGDAVDVVLIFLFCRQWFKAVRPSTASSLPQ